MVMAGREEPQLQATDRAAPEVAPQHRMTLGYLISLLRVCSPNP